MTLTFDPEAKVKAMNEAFARHDATFRGNHCGNLDGARANDKLGQRLKAELEAAGVKLVFNSKGYAEIAK